MSGAKVSIIIPVFNAASFLREALESALAQREIPCEIIAVDDGSTDGSRTILRSYGNAVTRLESGHGGASAARNLGTAKAVGEFFQYLDADDRLRPGAVAARVQALESSGGDVAYGGWQRLEETQGGRYVPGAQIQRDLAQIHHDPALAWLTQFWCPPAALLYRRRIVEKIGSWNPRLAYIQDARFGLDAALHGAKFVRVAGIGADYRVHSRSLSRRDPAGFVRDVFENAREVENYFRSRGNLSAEQRQALSDVYNYTSRQFLRMEDRLFDASLKALYGVQPGFRLNWPKTAGALASVVGPHTACRIMNVLQPISAALRGRTILPEERREAA